MGSTENRGHRAGGTFRMRSKHLWEWVQENRAVEGAAEVEMESVGETSGPESRE